MTTTPTIQILVGHVLDKLKELKDDSIHCVVTSPPYWGLRGYSRCGCALQPTSQSPPKEGFDIGFRSEHHIEMDLQGGALSKKSSDPNCPKCHGTGKDDSLTVVWDAEECVSCFHLKDEHDSHSIGSPYACFARQHGTESEITGYPDMGYISCWCQEYKSCEHEWGENAKQGAFCLKCHAWRGQLGLEPTPELYVQHIVQVFRGVHRVLREDGVLWLNMGDLYQNKQMVGMSWRIAFALQADGWYFRSDIIWSKPNPMPESVTDRPTKAHEYVFLLTKSSRYFYDADAVRETHKESWRSTGKTEMMGSGAAVEEGANQGFGLQKPRLYNPSGRHLRTVWTIATQPYPEAHFATFPEALAERCIKAGTKVGDIVLDPFAGSGTVGQVARSLGRSSILIEIKPDYINLIKERTNYYHKPLEGL